MDRGEHQPQGDEAEQAPPEERTVGARPPSEPPSQARRGRGEANPRTCELPAGGMIVRRGLRTARLAPRAGAACGSSAGGSGGVATLVVRAPGPLVTAKRPRIRSPKPENVVIALQYRKPRARKTVASRCWPLMSLPMTEPNDTLSRPSPRRANPLAQAGGRRRDDHRRRERARAPPSATRWKRELRAAALEVRRSHRSAHRADRQPTRSAS